MAISHHSVSRHADTFTSQIHTASSTESSKLHKLKQIISSLKRFDRQQQLEDAKSSVNSQMATLLHLISKQHAKLTHSITLLLNPVTNSNNKLKANTITNNSIINTETKQRINSESPTDLVKKNHGTSEPNELDFENAPINWIPAGVLIATPIAAVILTPWYLMTHKVKAPVWGVFAATLVWTGISITAGYHRLLSHRAYKAHPSVRNFFLVGATLAVQGSAFDWCSGHRTHHRYVDDRMQDPYSAKRGFWFSHIGWMLRNYPSGNFDYKNIPDLTNDKLLQIQHKYYGVWVLATNIGLISMLGRLAGDVKGTLILAGLLRLVINHHFTFFINSLCHMYGIRPYTDGNSARDNFILAIPTWGEGYHNYHHLFQYDYRNGVKWWQYDPTKWVIAALAKVGLATDLRTVDDLTIKHAEVKMQFKRAKQKITQLRDSNDSLSISHAYNTFRDRITFESALFNQTIKDWQALKAKAIEMKKNEFANRLNEVDQHLKQQYALIEARILSHNANLKKANQLLS